ncbi:MAG: GGDEF domain-containing protein [Christensenellaceae bacterium]|nr:GGDEF domain-containing protein [Christensenellaceae bacterium]
MGEEKNWEAFYTFLQKLLFSDQPVEASDMPDAPEECQRLLRQLGEYVNEMQSLSTALAWGQLSKMPKVSPENALCWNLQKIRRDMKASLEQAQGMGDGDFRRRVAVQSPLAAPLNRAAATIDKRERALAKEMDRLSRRIQPLEEETELLKFLLDQVDRWVVVSDAKNANVLFRNMPDLHGHVMDDEIREKVLEQIAQYDGSGKNSWEIRVEAAKSGRVRVFSVNSLPVVWREHQANVHMLSEVTGTWEDLQRMHEYAYNDELSGLYNRRHCIEKMEEYLRQGKRFAVCFADLDRLKDVNDEFGHSEGDRYIKRTAAAMRQAFRKQDVVCRIGGDEFVVLLQDCPEGTPEMRMRQVNERITEMAGEYDYPMDISFGVEWVEPGQGREVVEILKAADGKMYECKARHRDGEEAQEQPTVEEAAQQLTRQVEDQLQPEAKGAAESPADEQATQLELMPEE